MLQRTFLFVDHESIFLEEVTMVLLIYLRPEFGFGFMSNSKTRDFCEKKKNKDLL